MTVRDEAEQGGWGVKVLLLASFLATLMLGGCSDPMQARISLEDRGYTDIRIDRWGGWFQCDGGWQSTAFKAKNLDGTIVHGVVCVDHFYQINEPIVLVLNEEPPHA